MAKREPPPDDGVPGPGPWVVSFNDCMTNLLCFFVMLVSFSSFESEAKSKVAGAFQSMSQTSFLARLTPPQEAMMPQVEREFDITERGSEKPTHKPPQPTHEPKTDRPPPQVNPYSDRIVVRLSSSSLFWGDGAALTAQAKQRLAPVASFASLMPGQLIVREVASSDAEAGLKRAEAVASHLAEQARLGPQAGSISLPPRRADDPAEPTIEIILLKRRTLQWGAASPPKKSP